MASAFLIPDAPAQGRRIKRTAKPTGSRIDPRNVVDNLYRDFPVDMARLAE